MAGRENPWVEDGNVPGKSLKRLNTGTCTSFDIPVQQKRQKVSAIQYFQNGRGRFATKIREKLGQLGSAIASFVGPIESLKLSGCSDEQETTKLSAVLKHGENEVPMILDPTELPSLEPLMRQDEHMKAITSVEVNSGSCDDDPGDGPSKKMARTNSERSETSTKFDVRKEIIAKQEFVTLQENAFEVTSEPIKNKSPSKKSMEEDKIVTEKTCQGDNIKDSESCCDKMMVEVPISVQNFPMVEVPIGIQNFPQDHGNSYSGTAILSSGVAGGMVRNENGGFLCKEITFRRKVAARKLTYNEKIPSPERNGIVKDKDSLPKNAIVPSDQVLQELSKIGTPVVFPNFSGKGHDARYQVRETLCLFQATVRRLLRGEEGMLKGQQAVRRIDLTACKILQQANRCLNTGKPILGSVPGVEVGDEFHYRVELSIIGLHRPFQAGIDYTNERGMLLATSIVASGGYSDDMDDVDVLVYSGQGGLPTSRNKRPKDQKLERGNLALKNSIDAKIPVRVVRGCKEFRGSDSHNTSARNNITLTYYGLYSVERYWMERADHGFSVFKFELRRMPGQAELALREVKRSKQLAVREGLCVEDISNGEEKIPICAVNALDDERPSPFKYRAKMIYPLWYHPPPPQGCACIGGCTEWDKCACVTKNGGEIPFNHDGAIVEMKPLVYECGPACKCPPSCYNRVSQHGIRFRLEIFKTKSRGWGVRSLSSIPSGSFVCEYTGELLHDNDAEQRTSNDEYLFDIGRNYNDHSIIPSLNPGAPPRGAEVNCNFTIEADSGFTIDAADYGSVGRFVNHSCSPNLYTQNVLYDHGDKRVPHIMLFAAENIPPLQELTYDYNYTIGQVYDKDGNVKVKNCYCGSHECTGRLY
ncbi:hypothetical protein ACLOJK_030477 [Asimina triloba]